MKMRNINVSEIEKLVAELCIKANKKLPTALENKIRECGSIEASPVGKAVFDDLCANIDSAESEDLPICQDTGMAVVFMKIGQDVHIEGGLLRPGSAMPGILQARTLEWVAISLSNA